MTRVTLIESHRFNKYKVNSRWIVITHCLLIHACVNYYFIATGPHIIPCISLAPTTCQLCNMYHAMQQVLVRVSSWPYALLHTCFVIRNLRESPFYGLDTIWFGGHHLEFPLTERLDSTAHFIIHIEQNRFAWWNFSNSCRHRSHKFFAHRWRCALDPPRRVW